MAIKGKKKNRGSSPRRPAGAPRPAVSGARRHTPFYRTRDGLFIIAIFVAVAIGVVVWLVTDAQSKARERDERRDDLVQAALLDHLRGGRHRARRGAPG